MKNFVEKRLMCNIRSKMFQAEHRCNECAMGPAPKTRDRQCCAETMLRSVLFTTISPSAEQRTVDLMVPSSTSTTGAGNMGMSPSNFLLIQFPVSVHYRPIIRRHCHTGPPSATNSRETKPSPFIALSLGKP